MLVADCIQCMLGNKTKTITVETAPDAQFASYRKGATKDTFSLVWPPHLGPPPAAIVNGVKNGHGRIH